VRRPRSAVTAPLATLGWAAGLAVFAVGLAVLIAASAAGALAPGSRTLVAVLTGTVIVVAAVLAATAGRRLGHVIDGVVDAATRPGEGRPHGSAPAVPVRELDDLFTALAALQQRVRVSDELADRHRRNADNAAAGMFELLSGLVAAEEGARGQLSAELHDTVAQSLAVARRLLGEVRETVDLAPELQTAADYIDEAEESLRATMARTRPPALREGNLAAAVVLLRDDLAYRYALEIELQWPDVEFPIPLATAIVIYRFFQEALLNVVKHAEVDVARVTLDIDARFVLATVRDRGVGLPAMPAVAGRAGRHVGLGLLRERARLAGGRLDVVSDPGSGTTLTLRLPRPALPMASEKGGLPLPAQRTSTAAPAQRDDARHVGG
jgi:signal transduction histidine kinase